MKTIIHDPSPTCRLRNAIDRAHSDGLCQGTWLITSSTSVCRCLMTLPMSDEEAHTFLEDIQEAAARKARRENPGPHGDYDDVIGWAAATGRHNLARAYGLMLIAAQPLFTTAPDDVDSRRLIHLFDNLEPDELKDWTLNLLEKALTLAAEDEQAPSNHCQKEYLPVQHMI